MRLRIYLEDRHNLRMSLKERKGSRQCEIIGNLVLNMSEIVRVYRLGQRSGKLEQEELQGEVLPIYLEIIISFN